jgi:hypothetical protein
MPLEEQAVEGCVPFTPMPSEPTLEVAVLPVKEWARRKPLDATSKNELMRMSIQGQTDYTMQRDISSIGNPESVLE